MTSAGTCVWVLIVILGLHLPSQGCVAGRRRVYGEKGNLVGQGWGTVLRGPEG